MSYVAQMSTLGIIGSQGSTQAQMRPQEQLTLPQGEVVGRLQEALANQHNQFERFRYLTEQKFTTLSRDVMDMSIRLKEAQAIIDRYKDQMDVQSGREALQRYQQGADKRPPMDKPIDRNGVAPKDVQIMDIFNASRMRR